jgi:hypothetical protein
MEMQVDYKGLKTCFEGMPDPRVSGRTTHRLEDILFLTLCAVLCGMDDWEAIEQWGNHRVQWLRQFIEVEQGIPSHDTISRAFAALDNAVSFRNVLSAGSESWWRASGADRGH